MRTTLFQKILLRLLYLTPVGYILSTLELLTGERTKGIFIDLRRYSPIKSKIKQNPRPDERINWLINGIFLIFESWFVVTNQIGDDIGGGFAFVALVFGIVSIISAIFPNVSWNKKLGT